jgi:hypothetical protein
MQRPAPCACKTGGFQGMAEKNDSMTDNDDAGARLLTVLADTFSRGGAGGDHFDHRSIELELRGNAELLAALEFLEVRTATTGWRAGALSKQSKHRLRLWLSSVEGRELDGRRLERVSLGRYRVAVLRPRRKLSDAEPARRPIDIDDEAAGAALLAVLADTFWPGRPGGDQFDDRSIAREAGTRPELFAALGFLGASRATTGWRAGALSSESQTRIKQWLAAVEGRELGRRRLERGTLGRYRVGVLHQDELPPFC